MPAKPHHQASQNQGKKLRKPRLGAHVPTSGGMAKRSIEYAETIKAEAIQVFTSNPRGWAMPEPNSEADRAFVEKAAALDIETYVHAPFLINLGSPTEGTYKNSLASTAYSLRRGREINALGVVIHTGSAVDEGHVKQAWKQIHDGMMPILEKLDEKEQEELAQAWGKGATGRGIASGGAKALKELEKEQKTRTTRMVRDSLDAALLDIATLYRDIMMIQSGHVDSLINIEMAEEIRTLATILPTHRTIQKLDAIMKARKNLGYNAAPLLTIEALMCELV